VTHLTCPSCKLSISVHGPGAVMEYCPRCLARARRAVRVIPNERRGAAPAGNPDRACL